MEGQHRCLLCSQDPLASTSLFHCFGLIVGRLVITHNTYVEGLIPWLKELVTDPAIQTITPGVISRVKGRCVGLQLRISTPVTGGYKVMARRGTTAQEVFVVTTLDREELKERIHSTSP